MEFGCSCKKSMDLEPHYISYENKFQMGIEPDVKEQGF